MKSPLALSLLLALPAGATEWNSYGSRAMAMGGSGVAIAQGSVGNYWNPAGLGQEENPSGLQVPIAAHGAVTGNSFQGAADIFQVQKDCSNLGAGVGLCTQSNITNAINEINQPGTGVRADASGGAAVKIKNVVAFVNDFVYAAAIPHADTKAADTTPAALVAGANTSHLTLRGISVAEIGVGYGSELAFAPGLLIGANLKGLIGKVGYYDFNVLSQDPNSGSITRFTRSAATSVQPGIDLGALWDIHRTWEFVPMRPRIGITARNINNPKFTQPDAAKVAGDPTRFSLQGNVRAGLALSPLHFWNLVADADVTKNLTPLDSVRSQTVGAGTEVNVFNRTWLNLALRAGLSKNIAQTGSKTMLTGGFGLNFLHLNIDAAVEATPATQTIQSQKKSAKIPPEFGAAVQVGFMFGGGK